MCNPKDKATNTAKKMGGTPIDYYFKPEVFNKLLPNQVTPGHCLRCNKKLGKEEMDPPGRAPRYMCRTCYENLAYNTRKDLCIWCGCPLPDHQREAWEENPRELKHAFCQGTGRCLEYHWVLAGRVFGITHNTPPALPVPEYYHPNQNQALPAPDYSMQVPQHLPYPDNNGFFQPVAARNYESVQHQIPNRVIKKLSFLG